MTSVEIEPEILDGAIRYLSKTTAFEPTGVQWRTERIERKHSVIFRLTTNRSSAADPTIYYKVFTSDESPDSHSQHVDSMANRLDRTHRLTERLVEITQGSPIVPAPVLAVDTPLRTVVTLGVPGRELGRMVVPPLTSKASENKRVLFWLFGELCAAIETASSSEKPETDWSGLEARAARQIGRSDIDDDMLLRDLRDTVSGLIAATRRDTAPVFVHGDLSPTNILRTKKTISVVDFRWAARFPVFDLAVLSYRLRGDLRRWPGDTIHYQDALLTGYRQNRQEPSSAWGLANALLLARALGSGSSAVRQEGTAAVHGFLQANQGKLESGPNERPWWWLRT